MGQLNGQDDGDARMRRPGKRGRDHDAKNRIMIAARSDLTRGASSAGAKVSTRMCSASKVSPSPIAMRPSARVRLTPNPKDHEANDGQDRRALRHLPDLCCFDFSALKTSLGKSTMDSNLKFYLAESFKPGAGPITRWCAICSVSSDQCPSHAIFNARTSESTSTLRACKRIAMGNSFVLCSFAPVIGTGMAIPKAEARLLVDSRAHRCCTGRILLVAR